LPTTSGPSLDAAKAANEAIAKLDETLQSLGNASDPNVEADVQAAWNAMLDVVRSQRAALVNLIQQDVATVGIIN
jgi:hypothetical protein